MRSPFTRLVLMLLATVAVCLSATESTARSGGQVSAAVFGVSGDAGPDRQAALAPTSEDRRLQRLRARVEERWRVVRVRDGLVLVPRRASDGLRGIELTRDEILIDGRPVSGGEVRERLGADAEAVLGLSYLDEMARLELFQPAVRAAKPADAPRVSDTQSPTPPPVEPWSSSRHRRGSRVRIGSDLTIGENERIEGPAVAVLGSVQVDGEVRDEVVAVLGSVRLGPKAQVHGDVVSVGGRIEIDPQARVLGATNEVAFAWPHGWGDVSVSPRIYGAPWLGRDWWVGMSYLATSVRLGLIALLGAIVVLLGGRTYESVRGQIESTPWQAVLVGVGAQLVLIPSIMLVCLTLLVSVIGIPILALVPVGLVLLAVVWLIGFAGVAERVGQRLARGVGAGDIPPVVGFLIGFVVVSSVAWLSRVAWWGQWIGGVTAFTLIVLGAIIEGLAWAAGLGGVVLSWLRRGSPARVTPSPLTATIDGPAAL